MKKFTNKKYALSIVALILVLLMTIGITYSWIDDVKLVEINTSDDGTDIPLKTGVDINSTATIKDQRTISKDNKTINLGKVLSETEENDFVGKNLTQAQKETINKKKGYLYESGDMHFSGCYSDGESFYFPINDTTSYYREGNIDDENVNYIDVTLKVNSPDANVDFWFENVPTITDNNGKAIESARYSITVDGRRNIYSSTGEAQTVIGSALTDVSGVRKTAEYTYGNSNNKDNANTLFSIKKGSSVNLNVKIWVEGNIDKDIDSADINMSLVSSWAFTHNIKIVDKTSSCGITNTSNPSSSWIHDGGANLYWTLPSLLSKMYNNVGSWKNNTNYFKELSRNNDGTYTVKDVPLVYNNEDMVIYRDNSWNQGSKTDAYYGVKCYNWWYTNIPNSYVNCEYTLYGGSHDECASRYFKDDPKKETNQGYGTWGELEKIQVDPLTKSVNGKNLAPKINYDDEASTLNGYYLVGTINGKDVDNTQYKFVNGKLTLTITEDSYVVVRNANNDWFMTHGWLGKDVKEATLYKTYYGEENTNKLYVPAGKRTFILKKNSDDELLLSYGEADFYICDYSDYEATEELYIHGMSYNDDTKLWEAYVPKSSTLLQFYYHKEGTGNDKGCYWGYNSWNGVNLQQRPQGKTKYYLTHRIDESYGGIGYWQGAEDIYLIRNNDLKDANPPYVYLYDDDYNYYQAWHGSAMNDTGQTFPNTSEKIYKFTCTMKNNPGYYKYVIFNDNANVQYPARGTYLPNCPGCYFDLSTHKWLGSLTGTDRSPSSSGGGDTGGDASKVTTTMDGAGVYLYGSLDGKGKNQLCKMTQMSNGEYQAKLYLPASSDNYLYYIGVREASSSSSWQYYADSGLYIQLSDSMGTKEYNLNANDTQPLYLRVKYTHTYTFIYNKNDHKIKITK